MKIIEVDNLNRDSVSDRIVCQNIQNKEEGTLMLTALRATCSNASDWWYEMKPDDYKLYVYNPV